MEVERLIARLELYADHTNRSDSTLPIFDEVQEAPRALASLKYFNEDVPQYQIVCVSSLLGRLSIRGDPSR